MAKPIQQPQNTFVIRFWWEWQNQEAKRMRGWRGRIEHIQSGEGLTFHDEQQLLAFIERFIHRFSSLESDNADE